ncbi:hypothetical protein FKB34_11350 [Glycocaulis profundi]|nr:hypothetical protein FKB34_11350 [Glycocaulis profundi]
MADDVQRLVTRLEVRMNQFERGMERAAQRSDNASRRVQRQWSNTNRRLEREWRQVGRVAATAFAAVGVGLSARAVTSFVTGTLQAAEGISDVANAANAGAEALQELRLYADRNGSSAANLDRALQRLSSTAGDVLAGKTNQATRAVERLGLAQQIANGELQTSDQIFEAIVRRMETVTDANQQAAIATDLFGQRIGENLVQALRGGSDALEEFRRRARESGAILDSEMVQRAAAANVRLRELGQTIQGNLRAAILESVPAIESVMNVVADMLPRLAQWGAGVAEIFAQFGGGISASDSTRASNILESQAARLMNRQASVLNRADERELRAMLRQVFGNERAETETQRIAEIIGGMQRGQASGIIYGRTIDEAVAQRFLALAGDVRRSGRERARSRAAAFPPSFPTGTPETSGDGADTGQAEALALLRERLALEFERQEAEARGDEASVRRITRQLALMDRIAAYTGAQVENAEEQARIDQSRLDTLEDEASAQAAINDIIDARRELIEDTAHHELELARLSRDTARTRELERELYIRHRIAELMERIANMTADEARGIAVREADARDYARSQGDAREFARQAFRDGLLGALDGHAREAVSNFWRDTATRGLGRALDALADQFVDLLLRPGQGGGIGASIASIFGFGGNRATGGPVRAGQAYTVGEHGRETFIPSRPGVIIPNAAQMPQIGGKAPVHVHNHFAFHAEGAVLTDQLLQQMQQIGTVSGQLAVERARQVIPADLARSARHRFNR